MKKVILLAPILIALFSCDNKLQETTLLPTISSNGNLSNGDTIPNQYIIIMRESFDTALIKIIQYPISDTNRFGQKAANQALRNSKETKLKNFLDSNRVSYSQIFVDITIGAVVTMDSTKANALKDNRFVEVVLPDVVTQTNPIQQTDPDASTNPIQQWTSPPIPDTNPIQQNDSIQNRYDIDIVRHWTKALIAAGGPAPGTGKSAVIWFLDTGIDPSPYLNVNRALGKSFFGNSTEDDYGHGTLCAGVAAGKPLPAGADLDEIHYGVSEGATVVPVKVLDGSGTGNWGRVFAGLDHVTQFSRQGDIVNLSIGAYDPLNTTCPFPPRIGQSIIDLAARGVYVTLSAGNNAGNAAFNQPGCTNGNNIFTTSSVNGDLSCAPYANFGQPVDFVTVGTRVFSLWKDGAFIMATGTSISSGLLAGIIHARNSAPGSGGSVSCMGGAYIIAIRQ
jgi:hypothetical protein